MHISEEQLQRLLHGELDAMTQQSVRDHLATCADCRAGLEQAKREEAAVFGLLEKLDHVRHAPHASTLAARARAQRSTRVRWAAGILLAIGTAGAAYAFPPLRDWLNDRLKPATSGPEAAVIAPQPAPPDSRGGIAVTPGDQLIIEFSTPLEQGRARVILVDSLDVVVRVTGGTASFTSQPERLLIESSDPAATFEIQIPRSAPRVEIAIAHRRLWTKQGSQITSDAAAADSGSYLLRLGQPR